MARLPYRSREDLPPELQKSFDAIESERGFVPNLYRAMANAPALLRDFVQMGAGVRRQAALPALLKELAVLTVARLTGAQIMWHSHVPGARAAGASEAQLSAMGEGQRHTYFSDAERAAIAYAEEATRDVRVADQTWEAARAVLDDEQLAELVLTVAFFNMVARFTEPVRVDLDPEYLVEV